MKHATAREIIFINTYWIGLSFMWNSLHVIILPAVLLNLVPGALKNTYLGVLTFFGLVLAIIVQPISGSLSDRWRSRWGRRRPLILLGTAFDFVFLALLGWAGGFWWLAIGYLGLQFTSNMAHGPVQGLLPDRIPAEQMGMASGIKNVMDMVGIIISSVAMGIFVAPDVRHPIAAIAIVGVVLAGGALVTLLGIKEKPSDKEIISPPPQRPESTSIIRMDQIRQELHQHSGYWWLIASRFAFLFGVYGVQVFAQYYVRDVLIPVNPVQLTGNLMGAIALGITLFALLGGWLGDRFGHKRILVFASVVGSIGFLLMIGARTAGTLLVFGSVVGIGTGLFSTANWALANELAPSAQAGKYLGLTNLATGGAAAMGRLVGPVIDLLNNANPGAFWGYIFLFVSGSVLLLVSAWLLRWVPVGSRPAAVVQPQRVDV
ncbi:MAG TPA: MFS transporter [Anaerolineales bacterium]|jgi:MFS family permease|nr:MFS transporter [Anaerolineales bacterium]